MPRLDEYGEPISDALFKQWAKDDLIRQNLARAYNEKIAACENSLFFKVAHHLTGKFPERVKSCEDAAQKLENLMNLKR